MNGSTATSGRRVGQTQGARHLLTAIAAVTCLRTAMPCSAEVESADARVLPQQVYIWQRTWGHAVTSAVAQAAPHAAGFVALSAELAWQERGGASVIRVPLDHTALLAARRPVGLALRVGPYPPGRRNAAQDASLVAQAAAAVIADARKAGLEPSELQIDFDCAETRLPDYERWIPTVRESVHDTALTITALPCWLERPAFRSLASAVDGYVLQVHSLSAPAGPGKQPSLCEPADARRWVRQAEAIGRPFRVALPTYGYLTAFGPDGRLLGISAEGPARSWPADTTVHRMQSDAAAMAGLVAEWSRDSPSRLRGLVWYRLPVDGDRLNWKWATLQAVMQGRTPRRSVRTEVRNPSPELADIVLMNDGETDIALDFAVHARWDTGEPVASDAVSGFVASRLSQGGLCLSCAATAPALRPGDARQIGWIRFRSPTPLTIEAVHE